MPAPLSCAAVLNRWQITHRPPSILDPCQYPTATPAILTDRMPELYGYTVSSPALSREVVGSSQPVCSRVLAARDLWLEMEYQKANL